MRIAICDTDVGALEETKSLLDRYLLERDLDADPMTFVSSRDLLSARNDGIRYDIYILEAMLPKMDGVALGLKIRETQTDVPIVYVTKSTEWANASFAVSSSSYVLKPCDYEVFAATLDRARCRRRVCTR